MSKKDFPRSPLRGKYLVQNPFANFLLRSVDFFLSVFFKQKKIDLSNYQPKRILLSNIAHLGDVVIATSILPVIKKNFTDCKIGFLIGSWSKEILDKHPMVDYLHFVDHWKLNRSNLSLLKKVVRYYQTKRKAISEIKEKKYDVAIDLYYFFPNSIPIFWQTNIPYRIGYISGGFGPLLSHSLEWRNLDQYVGRFHLDLLKFLSIEKDKNIKPSMDLISLKVSLKNIFFNKLLGQRYFVFHLGTGDPVKEWSLEEWKSLAKKVIEDGYSIVFTGKGKREKKNIDYVMNGLDKCCNLCDKLNVVELIKVIKESQHVICCDSVVSHIASSFNLNTTVIFYKGHNEKQWVLSSNTTQIEKID